MNRMLPTIVIVNLLLSSTTVLCHQHHDSLDLINRLNDFYRFDHLIFLTDSSIHLNRWIPFDSGTQFTPQSIYTSDGLSKQTANSTLTSRNTFLVAVVDELSFDNESTLLTQIKEIRSPIVNLKVGVFFVRNITSLRVIEKLFRRSWSVGIVNIFIAFHMNGQNGGPSPLNIFKCDPFDDFALINLTKSESLRDYFSDGNPNYRKHPLRLVNIREYHTSPVEKQIWNVVRRVFNTSLSMKHINHGQWDRNSRQDFLANSLEQRAHKVCLYPYQQVVTQLIVPHAKPYSNVMAYLQNRAWTRLFVYTAIVVTMSSLLLVISGYLRKKKISPFQRLVDVVNLLLSENSAIRYGNLYRAEVFIILPLTFTGLIVMNGILSLLQSYLTSPIYQPQINSVEDLYKSSTLIIENVEAGLVDQYARKLEDISKHGGWIEKFHEVLGDEITAEIETFNGSIAFFSNEADAQVLLDVQKRLGLEAYHLLRDNFFAKNLISFEVRPDYPFVEPINDIIHRLQSGALIDKWMKEQREENEQFLLYLNQLSTRIESPTDEFSFMFLFVLWCGWMASGVVFLCEIIWNRIQSHRQYKLKIRTGMGHLQKVQR